MSTRTPKRDRPTIEVDLAERWGDNVRKARRAFLDTGLTQVQLAERCKITQQSLSQIEKGETIPRDGLKIKIAQALGVAVADLFDWDGER